MSVCFYKQHCRTGEFDQSFIDKFFEQYFFVPMKEIVYSIEEDKSRIYITYNTDGIKVLGDMPITRNIWCFDKKTGERLWVIQEADINLDNRPNLYSAASIREDGILHVGSTQGFDYNLDPITGRISNPVFTK